MCIFASLCNREVSILDAMSYNLPFPHTFCVCCQSFTPLSLLSYGFHSSLYRSFRFHFAFSRAVTYEWSLPSNAFLLSMSLLLKGCIFLPSLKSTYSWPYFSLKYQCISSFLLSLNLDDYFLLPVFNFLTSLCSYTYEFCPHWFTKTINANIINFLIFIFF